jgi:DNA-binding IclR family transcriptional regulator
MKLNWESQGEVKPFYNRSLERALQILNAFSNERPFLSLAQLAESLNLSRATVLRLCSTLLKFRFLRQDQRSKQYSLGLRLFELGSGVMDSFSLRSIAGNYLSLLQAKLGKTIFLGILDDDEVLYIDKRDDPRNAISFTSKIGTRRPPYWGMMGSVLMAYMPDSEIERILQKSPLTAFAKKSITRKDQFLKWLRLVRKQGYVIDVEMGLDGITGVAAPVFDRTGKVIAGLGVGFISSSVSARELEIIVKEVTKTALIISKELGYPRDSEVNGKGDSKGI